MEAKTFVAQITLYLRSFLTILLENRERTHLKKDAQKAYADEKRRTGPKFQVRDKVLVATRLLSGKAIMAKLMDLMQSAASTALRHSMRMHPYHP